VNYNVRFSDWLNLRKKDNTVNKNAKKCNPTLPSKPVTINTAVQI